MAELECEAVVEPWLEDDREAPADGGLREAGSDNNEDGDDEGCGPAYFEEEEECHELLRRVAQLLPAERDILLPTAGQEAAGAVALVEDKFAKILDRYQESSHLLHPHLERLMGTLVELLIRYMPEATEVWALETSLFVGGEAGKSDLVTKGQGSGGLVVRANALGQNFDMFDIDAPKYPLHLVCRALYVIIKTVGDKCCTSYFPNAVSYYEDVFYTLRLWRNDPTRQREWEVRYCLLLWLSNLVLVPFDLKVIDTHATPIPAAAPIECTFEKAMPLSDAMLVTAVSFLADTSKCREGAALLIARLLTRSDSAGHRKLFFIYAREVLAGVPLSERVSSSSEQGQIALSLLLPEESDSSRVFLIPGILLAIAKAMKLGQRQELVPYAGPLIACITSLYERRGNDCLLCKTAVKVQQRLVLSMLKRKTASWKYKRHVASLEANLGAPSPSAGAASAVDADVNADDNDEAIDGDRDQLEDGIGLLLEAVGHKDTVVRWSAAKGIGRVCDRLPSGLAADVMGAVMSLFTESDTDDRSWHGGLLALAELCRRSIIMADRLRAVVQVISKGLGFDLSKGTYSVGAHVRDAACYACWSIARAYDAIDLEAHVHALSAALVVTSLYDREVNVRRAAAAAFQECVGRLGTFPDGISLVTTMDFFSLSSLKNAYLSVGPTVSQYAAYRPAMLEELVSTKLSHWDRAVRQSAARALGMLAPLETATVLIEVFPELQRRVLDQSVAVRHGAILGLAELVRGLSVSVWTEAQRGSIADVVVRLDAARLFRARGGEYTRHAGCRLLSACAEVELPLREFVAIKKISGAEGKARTLGKMQEFLEETWCNILSWLQLEAADTFRRFASVYYTAYQEPFHSKVMEKMLEGCRPGKSPLERRGFLAAIGGLPTCLLVASSAADGATGEKEGASVPYFIRVINTLRGGCLVNESEDVELADPEARRNAVRSLAQVLLSVPASHPFVTAVWYCEAAIDTLLAALQDYAVDKRGDVGSFVRLAVLQALPSVVAYGAQHSARDAAGARLCTDTVCVCALQGCVKAAMEKSDRVRAAAGAALVDLLAENGAATTLLGQRGDGADTLEGSREEVALLASLVRGLDSPQMEWSSPQHVIRGLAPRLLRSTPELFSFAVMEGIVLAAGDLSTHVQRPAMEALLCGLTGPVDGADHSIAMELRKEDCPADPQERLSRELVRVAVTHAHCDRVIVPWSRTADGVINAGAFATCVHHDVVEVLRGELKHFATAITVLLSLVALLANLCRSACPRARLGAWGLALTMIASRYPKVRAKMASEFYAALLVLTSSSDDSAGGALPREGCLQAMQHLSDTQWDSADVTKVRTARNALYGMLGVAVPTRRAEGAGEMEMQPAREGRGAVASSYMHLVREAGY